VSVDPAAAWILRVALASLFGAAAFHKLRDPRGFAGTLRDYEILPTGWPRAVAVALPGLELALALALLLPGLGPRPALVGAALLALYSGAIAWNLARGRTAIDCGCLGPAGYAPLSPGLLARNAVLIGACLALTLPAGDRALLWVDALTIAAGSLAATLLFLTANRLALAPPAAGLRRTA
jgi:uncharacterized membrane protein YphA (DoxX/SURF4 family)